MGAYLSEPKTKKTSSDQVGKNVAYGASSMQGWRISQEDAHNCYMHFDDDVSLFAVYDGHGGHEVAAYCAKNLPEFIKNTEAYKNGDIEQALIDAFLGFDATLIKPEVIKILKDIATKKDPDDHESDEEENVSNLCMEASMPLDELMAKYRSEIAISSDKNVKSENINIPTCSASPCIRNRRGKDKPSTCSSIPGCSTSSSYWNTNETDVSSSSQHCGSSSSMNKDGKVTDCPGSSEAEQVLDSTTSNGDIAHIEKPVGSTDDAKPIKNVDMPDSSGDIESCSPSKSECTDLKGDSKEKNGTNCDANTGNADSTKVSGDNVSSSSSMPMENGEIQQQQQCADITSKRRQRMSVYQSLLQDKQDDEDDDDDDEDEDDENYENVDGTGESDTDEDVGDTEDDDDDDDDDDEDEVYYEDEEDDELALFHVEKSGYDSGCTAVVAILKGNDLYVANAGDSRCVLCRNGQAVELSLDHKPEDEVELERIVNAGGIVTADGRVNGGLNLSRALGDHSYKRNTELPAKDQMISALPDIRHVSIDPKQDEFMILACDGIWNFMSSQDVVDFIRPRIQKNYQNISKICEELFDHCLAPNTFGDGTGCDNMTAVIVKFQVPEQNDVDSAPTEETIAKKRSMTSDGEIESGVHENVTECKRLKTEIV